MNFTSGARPHTVENGHLQGEGRGVNAGCAGGVNAYIHNEQKSFENSSPFPSLSPSARVCHDGHDGCLDVHAVAPS